MSKSKRLSNRDVVNIVLSLFSHEMDKRKSLEAIGRSCDTKGLKVFKNHKVKAFIAEIQAVKATAEQAMADCKAERTLESESWMYDCLYDLAEIYQDPEGMISCTDAKAKLYKNGVQGQDIAVLLL